MPRSDSVKSVFPCIFKEIFKFYLSVTHNARIGRSRHFIFFGKILHYDSRELFSAIYFMQRNTKLGCRNSRSLNIRVFVHFQYRPLYEITVLAKSCYRIGTVSTAAQTKQNPFVWHIYSPQKQSGGKSHIITYKYNNEENLSSPRFIIPRPREPFLFQNLWDGLSCHNNRQ